MNLNILLVASKNPNKIKEIQAYLKGKLTILSLLDYPDVPIAPETGSTFRENAFQKAAWYYNYLKIPVLSDDSGLEVEALSGAPGVHSAHFAGPQATDEENRAKLLACMEGIWNRRARFICVLCLYLSPDSYFFFEGTVKGYILTKERGKRGFGYDPLFLPEEYKRTFAEMPLEEKNQISHRARALQKLLTFYQNNGEKILPSRNYRR